MRLQKYAFCSNWFSHTYLPTHPLTSCDVFWTQNQYVSDPFLGQFGKIVYVKNKKKSIQDRRNFWKENLKRLASNQRYIIFCFSTLFFITSVGNLPESEDLMWQLQWECSAIHSNNKSFRGSQIEILSN